MSFTGRHRYQDPRKKIKSHKRIVYTSAIILFIGLGVLIYKNRYAAAEWVQALFS